MKHDSYRKSVISLSNNLLHQKLASLSTLFVVAVFIFLLSFYHPFLLSFLLEHITAHLIQTCHNCMTSCLTHALPSNQQHSVQPHYQDRMLDTSQPSGQITQSTRYKLNGIPMQVRQKHTLQQKCYVKAAAKRLYRTQKQIREGYLERGLHITPTLCAAFKCQWLPLSCFITTVSITLTQDKKLQKCLNIAQLQLGRNCY